MMRRARSVWWWTAVACMTSAAGALGCRDACNEGAVAKDGMCVPTCPGAKCGDGACTRYVWPDGVWNTDLRCETHTSCAKDCSNLDQNLGQAIFFILNGIESDSNLPNPANNQSGSATCSGGGQAALSGSRWCQDNGGTKTCLHDVSYTFTNCVASNGYPEARLTFANGTLRAYSGYQDPNPTGLTATEISGQVTLSGTVSVGYVLDATDETLPAASCTMDFYQTIGTQFTTTGTMCGRAITMPVYQPDETSP